MITSPAKRSTSHRIACAMSAIGVLGLFTTTAGAQQLPRIKPGGWQYETSVANTAIPGLPPEAAAMLDRAINKVTKAKFCITPEDSESFAKQLTNPGGSHECEFKNVTNKGTTYHWEMHCSTGEDASGFSSVSTMEKPNDDSFTMKAETKIESRKGDVTTNVTTKGSFLGADCKAVGAKTYKEILSEAKDQLKDLSSKGGVVPHGSK